jgi:hypothetical protein
MQDDQTTNLTLARRRSDTSYSWNHSISSELARKLTVATCTNEVAMWALPLYIGLFPNFHSPFQEPTASIFRTVFSHGISVPPPTSWLSLGHFSSRAPGAPLFHIMARYARALSHLFGILFRYCSLWVFGCSVCRYLIIISSHHSFRYMLSTGM